MGGIGSLRRFYLLKRMDAKNLGEHALSATWRSYQEAEPGTPLPDDFPYKSKLAAVGYVAQEDLGPEADEDELMQYAGLSRREACAVIAAVAAL